MLRRRRRRGEGDGERERDEGEGRCIHEYVTEFSGDVITSS